MTSIVIDNLQDPIEQPVVMPDEVQFPHTVYNFLRYFCNYDVHEPLRLIAGLANVLQKTSLTDSQRDYLATMQHTTHEMVSVLETVRTLADLEHGLIDLRDYVPTAVDLRPMLMQGIALAYTGTELENVHRQKAVANMSTSEPIPSESASPARVPTEVSVDIPTTLPQVRVNAWVVQTIIEELTWLVLRPQLKTAILFAAEIVNDAVQVTIGYQGFNVDAQLAEKLAEFETVPTGLAFDVDARPLYLCWRLLQAYNGHLSVAVVESDAVCTPSEMRITFTLPLM